MLYNKPLAKIDSIFTRGSMIQELVSCPKAGFQVGVS